MTSRSRTRKISSKAKRIQLMIFVEGEETEPAYFSHWHRLCREHVIVKVAPHQGTSTPFELVERAIEQRKKDLIEANRGRGDAYNQYWCVFDVDRHPRLDEALALADAEDIKIALSNPCIELWLILHFKQQAAYLETHSAKKIAKEVLGCGETLTPHALKELTQRYTEAKNNARKLDDKHAGDGSPPRSNPSSEIWRLIDIIKGHSTAA